MENLTFPPAEPGGTITAGINDLAFKKNKLVIQSICNKNDGLWDIPIPQDTLSHFLQKQPKQMANGIIHKNTTQCRFLNFYHGALCIFTIKMLTQAIKNDQLISWPTIDKNKFS